MDFLILFLVAVVSFVWGWNTRERVAIRQSDRFFENLVKKEIEEQENLIRIKIEKHNGMLFAYHSENSLFIAQANGKEELEEILKQKFPGRRFGCSEENLKEGGFIL